MADAMLEIGVRFDGGTIATGMQTAAQATQTATAQMQGSFDKLAVVTRQSIFDQVNLRGVIRQLIAGELPGEALQLEALSDAMQRSSQSAQELSAVKQELAQESIAAAQQEVDAERQKGIEQKRQYEEYVASQAAMRAAESEAQAASVVAAKEASAQKSIEQKRQYEEFLQMQAVESAAAKEASQAQVAAQREADAQIEIERRRQYEEYIVQSKAEATAAEEAAAQEAAAVKEATRIKEIEQKRQYEEYVAQQRAENAAGGESISKLQAVRGLTRSLRGEVGMLTMERFLSQFEAVNAAAMQLFNVLGAIGVGVALFQIGEQLYDLEQKGVHAGEETSRAFGELTQRISTTNDELDLTNSRLQDQIDKLEGHPNDGLETSLLRDVAAADKLQQSLAAVVREIEAKNKENSVGYVESAVSGAAPTAGTDKEIRRYDADVEAQTQKAQDAYEQRLSLAKQAHDREVQEAAGNAERIRAAEANLHAAQEVEAQAHQTRMDQILSKAQQDMQARADQIQAKQDGKAPRSAMDDLIGVTDFSDQIASFQGVANAYGAEKGTVDRTALNDQLEARRGADEQKKQEGTVDNKAAEAQRKADEAKFKAMEEGRVKEEEQGQLGAAADMRYWQARIHAFGEGSDQYKAIQTKIQADRQKLAQGAQQYSAEQTRGDEIQARSAESLALANIQLDLASGKITKVAADQRTAAVQADAYAARIAALRHELELLNAAKDISPEEKQEKGAGLQNQIAETQGQAQAAAINESARALAALREERLRASEAQERLNEEVTKGNEIDAKNVESLDLARIKAAEAGGGISRLSVLQAEAAIHTQEHTDKVLELYNALADLQEEAQGLTPGSAAANQNAARQQSVENQIGQENGAAATQATTDQGAIAAQKSAPYMQATQQISNGLSGALASWEKGQQSFVSSFGRSLGQMVLSMQSHLLQMAAMWAAHELQGILLHTAANQVKVASDTTAAAQSKSIGLSESLSQANQAAMKAATNTYASVSAVPIVGPVLAPIAAAGAYTAVLGLTALASAEGGWGSVPADNTLANLHKNEMVLPAKYAENIRNMTSNSHSSITNNFGGNTINGGGKSLPEMLDDHEDAVASKLGQMHRDGKLNFAR